jgi:hypothetical protein
VLLDELFSRQADIFRLRRHDFLNQLQLMRAYLQMNKPAKALACIDDAIASLGAEQEISRLADRVMQGIMFHWYYDLIEAGVETQILTPAVFQEEEFWRAKPPGYTTAFYEFTRRVSRSLPVAPPATLDADIRFEPVGADFSCCFRLYRGGEPFSENSHLLFECLP